MRRIILAVILVSMALSISATCIQKQTSYTNSLGDPIVVGEVVNNSGAAVSTTVRATLYDSAGNVIGVRDSTACIDPLPAGGTSPFELYLEKGVAYRLETIDDTDSWLTPAWGLTASSRSWFDSMGWLHVGGTVYNGGDRTWSFTKVCISFYDAAGKVIRTEYTYPDPDPAPGQTVPFEVEMWDDVTVAGYAVFVGGWD
jgi:hypothetical protein